MSDTRWDDSDIRELLVPDEYVPDEDTAAWLKDRCGFCTASRFRDVLDFTQDRVTKGRTTKAGKVIVPSNVIKGREGAKRAAYRAEIIIARVTGHYVDHYVSQPMRDGIEREPMAKMAYEARTGRMLQDHGFKRHDTLRWVGGSPDALLDDNGGAEFKCPTPTVHLETLLHGMDEEHLPQVQGYIWIFDADYWDFCSYNPLFDEPMRTYIQRIPRDQAYIDVLESGVRQFLSEVDAELIALGKLYGSDLPFEGNA